MQTDLFSTSTPAKAYTSPEEFPVVCEIKVIYQGTRPPFEERVKIDGSKAAADIFKRSWDKSTINLLEEAKILLIDRAHHILGIVPISKGGMAGTVVDEKVVFSSALVAGAHYIIVAHSHPSGNLKPSDADISLTTKLVKGAKLLGMEILDHLIITERSYFSFADDGYIDH